MAETTTFEKVLSVINTSGVDKIAIENVFYQIHSYSTSEKDAEIQEFDFTDPVNRLAYLYIHFNSICDATEHFWHIFANETIVSDLITRNHIKVCSIGGGPATDLFGLNLFLIAKEFEGEIEGTILDYYTDWKEEAVKLQREFMLEGKNKILKIDYKIFDYLKLDIEDCVQEEIKNSDIVSIVKFFSVLAQNSTRCDRLKGILKSMKSGGILFILDNTSSFDYQSLSEVLESEGLSKIIWINHEEVSVSSNQIGIKIFATLWKKKL